MGFKQEDAEIVVRTYAHDSARVVGECRGPPSPVLLRFAQALASVLVDVVSLP